MINAVINICLLLLESALVLQQEEHKLLTIDLDQLHQVLQDSFVVDESLVLFLKEGEGLWRSHVNQDLEGIYELFLELV